MPADAAPGLVTVTVRAGGWGTPEPGTTMGHEPTDEDLPNQLPNLPETEAPDNGGLEKLLRQFAEREVNNSLVVEFFPPAPLPEHQDQSAEQPGPGADGGPSRLG